MPTRSADLFTARNDADPTAQPFTCADESAHYAFSVCMLLQQYREFVPWQAQGVDELGSGDASAIADLVASQPELRVRGFDISAVSVQRARENIAARRVADRYTVELADFFDGTESDGTEFDGTGSDGTEFDGTGSDGTGSAAARPRASTAIANPPYIPAPDRQILMPELWGGEYGNDLTLQLLTAGYDHLVVALPSYADPVTTLATAADLGYRVVNFLAMGLDFGAYSSEPVVRAQIRRIVAEGRGWAGDDEYMVAVALLTRDPSVPGDRTGSLMRALHLTD